MPIVRIPDKNMVVRFPDEMAPEDIEMAIRRDIYGEMPEPTIGERIKETMAPRWPHISERIQGFQEQARAPMPELTTDLPGTAAFMPELQPEPAEPVSPLKLGKDVISKVLDIDRIATEKAIDFVGSVGRAAGRKLIPPAFDQELADKSDTASGLYRGGEPISHEELIDHFVNPQKHGTSWNPMSYEDADQFIRDQQNLEFVENLVLLGLIGHGVYQGIRNVPAMWRALKQDFSEYLWKEVPRESLSLAERVKKAGLNYQRLAEITKGTGKPPTEKELEQIERISQPRQFRGIGGFMKKWFGTEKPAEPFVPRGLPGHPAPQVRPEPPKEAPLAPAVTPEKPLPKEIKYKILYHGANKEGTSAIEKTGTIGGGEERVFLTPDYGAALEHAKAKGGKVFQVSSKDLPSEWLEEIETGPISIPQKKLGGKPIPAIGVAPREEITPKAEPRLTAIGKLKPTTIMEAELRSKKKQWGKPGETPPEKMKGGLFAEERKQIKMPFGKPKPKPPEKAKTFIEWVRRVGGIWDESLKGEMAEFTPKESKIMGLVRKGGQPFDTLVTQAIEDQWLPEGSTGDTLREMLRDDIRAMKQKGPRMQPVWAAKDIERKKGFPIKKKEQPDTKTSRQAILKYIEKNLAVPIRIGRFRQRAEGIYKEKAKVIRLKKPLDVEVAAHEIGHHLMNVLGFEKKGIPEEVQALAYAGAKDKHKEGFAEFIRYYLTDEAEARKRAPGKFYEELETRLYEYPDIRDSLIQVRQAWSEWKASPSQDKIGSIIESGKREKRLPTINQLYTIVIDELRPLEELKTLAETKRGKPFKPSEDPFTLAWLTRGWARKAENFLKYGTFQVRPEGIQFTGPSLKEILQPVEFAGERHLLDRYLVAKRAESDPRILKGFEKIIEKEDFQQTVKELESKFKPVAEKLYTYQDELLQYLVDAGRISDQTRNAIKEKNLFYAPFYRLMDVDEPALGLSRKKFANLFQPIKKLKGSARPIISPTENIIKNTYAIINAAERNRVGDAIIKLSQIEGIGQWIERLPVNIKPLMIPTKQLQYVLRRYGKWRETVTYREIKKELGDTISRVSGKTPAEKVENVALEALQHRGWTESEAKQILERLKGAKTEAEREKIIERVVEKTAITEIIREYGFDITDPAVAIFRPNYRTRPNEVIFYDKGNPKVYELDPDIYRSVMALDADSLNMITKVFAYPAKWLRAGAVRFSLEFALKNPVRDQFTALVYSKYGLRPGYDFIRGLYHVFKADHLWQQYNASGAAHASMVSLDRDYVHKTYKDFVKSIGYKQMVSPKGVSRMLRHPLEGLQMLTELTEEATRVGEFIRGLEKEGQDLNTILNAGKAARDITLDFSRIGSKMRAYNAIVAFQNAGIQGIDKMRRAFKENPGKTSLKALLYLTLPTVLLWWAQKDDPAYQELPYWRKILCWNIVTHNPDGSVKHIWWIPKPFEIGIIFGSIPEAAVDWAYHRDPQAFKETFKELGRTLNPGMIPTVLGPIMEWFANKSWFFDRPIVPRGREALSPELQYRPTTPESVKLLTKGMAKIPGVKQYASPAKITNLIRGYTGSFGYITLEGIDELLKRTGMVDMPIEPEKKLTEYPGLRVFTQRFPMSNAKSIEDFYRKYEELERNWQDKREKAGIRGYGVKIEPPNDLGEYREVAKKLNAMRKVVDIIYKSDINAAQKRQNLDVLYLTMINIARVKLGRSQIKIPTIKNQLGKVYPWQKNK